MAKKRLIDKLDAERKKRKPAHKGVVAILAHKDEILEALQKGYTMKEIHTVMFESQTMPVGYAAFTRLVNKYIKKEGLQRQQENSQAAETASPKSHVFNPADYDPEKLV